MLTFYDCLPSQNAFKVRLLLSYLQVPHKTQFVSIFEGEGRTPEYRAINPSGVVPAIRLEDGRCLAESNAILFYLAEASPYLPDDRFGRAKVNQWLSFEQDYIQNTIGSVRYWMMTGKAERRPPELIESRRAIGVKALQILDHELTIRPFICGDEYTIADMALYAYASRAHEAGITLGTYSAFNSWVERLEQEPGFLKTVHPYSVDPHSAGEL